MILFLWKKEERLFQKSLVWILLSVQWIVNRLIILKIVRNATPNWFVNRERHSIIVRIFMNVRHKSSEELNILSEEKQWILKVWAEKPLRCFTKTVWLRIMPICMN